MLKNRDSKQHRETPPPNLRGAAGQATETLSDAGLVAAIARGSNDALAEVFRRHGAVVYGLTRGLCGPSEAERITGEVFRALWRSPESYGPERGALRPLVAAEAHARAVTWRRRFGHASDEHTDSLAGRIGAEAHGLLAMLQPSQRDAIVLAHLDGYTYRQIADRLQESEQTIIQAIRSGLGHLARLATMAHAPPVAAILLTSSGPATTTTEAIDSSASPVAPTPDTPSV